MKAFAQSDLVVSFMEGIDPRLKNYLLQDIYQIFQEYPKILLEVFKSKISKDEIQNISGKLQNIAKRQFEIYSAKLRDIQSSRFVRPIIDTIRFLPKSEMATLAESLIHLTSLKRKYSLESETVAGPIDVVVISKGDGLIWIKRKHYFEKDLNFHFFENYFRGEKYEK